MSAPETLGGGRYTVRGVLGEGAQGTTFDAVDQAGRPVAIKRFDVRGAKSWKDVELAEREVRVLKTIDHPLVPRYVENFEEDGALFLVMEKVEGETLEAIRRREGALPEDEVRRFLADADRALTYLHGRASPIVHRDIKPRNIVRRPNGSYVIVDFGAVAELIQRRHGASTVVGTMGFMAPEQFQGRALPATDVYAVGATALAMLAGADPDTLPHRGLQVDVRAAVGSRVSQTMTASLEHMLEPDPDRRAQSLGAALDDVRRSASYGPAGGAAPVAPGPPAPFAPGPPFMQPAPFAPGPFMQPPFGAPSPQDQRRDVMVRSLRRLLWVLWGVGWIIVPVSLGQLGLGRAVAPVMFGSLALLIILTWHKGAAIRAILERLASRNAARAHAAQRGAPAIAPAGDQVRARVDLGQPAQVRVHTTDVHADELGQTERATAEAQHAARRS